MTHRFPYKWKLADGYPPSSGLKVFGTFICGGGSTMGYKLAGYTHLGGVEIDPQVADVYKTNHAPKYLYVEDIRKFNDRTDLPQELFDLDILDGSPPCSTFSMAGSREKAWGKEKQFREGQAVQTLDDLVFTYCDTIKKLRPKVFLLENVKGIIQGNARAYSKKIVETMTKAGYTVQVFLLNAASMGVPQRRERVFFIGHREELRFGKLRLDFRERAVVFGSATLDLEANGNKKWIQLTDFQRNIWNKCKQGETFDKYNNGNTFNHYKASDADVHPTIPAQQHTCYHSTEPRHLYKSEFCALGTYPQDYDFKKLKYGYLIGMSVPPVMTAQIAAQIREQWFKQ